MLVLDIQYQVHGLIYVLLWLGWQAVDYKSHKGPSIIVDIFLYENSYRKRAGVVHSQKSLIICLTEVNFHEYQC